MDFIPNTYNPGLLGSNYDSTKTILVLHYSDSRAPIPHEEEGYKRALLATNTGKNILEVLKIAHKYLDDFLITNYVKELLPNDAHPKKIHYDISKLHLLKQIEKFQPEKIVLFGSHVYKHFFEDNSLSNGEVFKIRYSNSVAIMPSIHPSSLRLCPRKERVDKMNIIANFLK